MRDFSKTFKVENLTNKEWDTTYKKIYETKGYADEAEDIWNGGAVDKNRTIQALQKTINSANQAIQILKSIKVGNVKFNNKEITVHHDGDYRIRTGDDGLFYVYKNFDQIAKKIKTLTEAMQIIEKDKK